MASGMIAQKGVEILKSTLRFLEGFAFQYTLTIRKVSLKRNGGRGGWQVGEAVNQLLLCFKLTDRVVTFIFSRKIVRNVLYSLLRVTQ